MRRIIAAGFVLLFTAGTALAADTADTKGTFLDRVATYFRLSAKNSPEPGASVPSGRTALDSRTPLGGQPCTCVVPPSHDGSPPERVLGVTQSDGSCVPAPAGNGPRYKTP